MLKTIVKSTVFAFFAFFALHQAFAQYGNEWIQYNQSYFKIPVGKDGIYRLTYTDLQSAGFPVNTIDPRRIQIFHRGVEQRILVQGENDAVFHPADYIEFYGRKNDGTNETELYQPASAQPHPYYSLYSDTTAYFLTVNAIAQLGLRMEPFSEINVSALPAETFHTDQKLTLFTSEYSTGMIYNSYLQNSFFDVGEGWTGVTFSQGQFFDYVVENIVNTVPASGTPQLTVQVAGRADINHQVEILVGPTTPSRVIGTASFYGVNVTTITALLNWTDIGSDGKMSVRVRAVAGVERLSASYIKISFTQSLNQGSANEKVFQLTDNGGNKSYVEIQNAPVGTRLFDITDPANVVPIGTTLTSTLNAVIPNTSISRKILSTSSIITPDIRPVTFRNIDPSLHDYIIISHQALMKPAGGYTNVVKEYATYRASAAGGSYDTIVANINQLYNEFNYGEISPLAIRRFMKFMVDGGDPQYLFLIGKGLDAWHNYHRNPSSFSFHDFVPSAGMPASDILYTAGLNGTDFEPGVPTGRITAYTPADVAAYLNKVKEMEALPFNDLWRKELLHLSGGINPGEPEQFKEYLEEFAETAEGFYYGAHTTAIPKSSTEIEFVNVSDQVNKGVSLITLFGHSSPSQNDFNIGFVSSPELGYDNKGKYPMLLINGCNAGDFFATTVRYGEDWINTPNKGAVGFMANTSFGYISLLRLYSYFFYNTAYADSTFIYKSIGLIQKKVTKEITDYSATTPYITQGQQMLLLGDPSVKLFGAKKPDFETNDNHVYAESYDAQPITALSDSFAIKIIVRNFGSAKEDSLAVRIVRTLNDNSTVTYDSIFYTVLYRDTLEFTIYKDEQGFGNNTFTITLDPLNEINEIDKGNNTGVLNMFVPSGLAKNLFPQGFAIVNTSSVKLTVQSTDVISDPRDFIIQLDTVDTFDSQYLQQFTVNGKVATKDVTILTSVDTLAFYWRTRLAQPLANESADWTTSSFTYVKNGPEGWVQVHFPQYLTNETSGLVKDADSRMLVLQETVTDLDIHTFGANHPASFTQVSVKLNDAEYNPVSLPEVQCRDNTINLMVFNKTTTTPYMPVAVQYPDKRACGRRPEVITSFQLTELETGNKDLIEYITNVLPGDSVVLFSIGDAGYASWSANVKTKLTELGISSAQVALLQAGEPVVIFAKKGTPAGSATLIKTSASPADQQQLITSATITGRYLSGTMTSSVIGPAVAWQNLQTKPVISETPVTDQFSFDVVGISITGQESILKTGLINTVENIADIDADQYPYLRIVYHASDEINLTAPQLNQWLVSYTPAPEGVLIYTGSPETQIMKEGESWTGSFGFRNISTKTF
ncbi:MAG TPA: C25 family cysteine peptidase, partial [Cyclobacteriaceae bacterium]